MSFMWNIFNVLMFNERVQKYTALMPLTLKTTACVSAIRIHHKEKKMKMKEMHYNICCSLKNIKLLLSKF
jgi:hypothetical protein